MAKRLPVKNRYITRINGRNCWQFKFDRKEIYLSKVFSDGKYGGKRKALIAARQHRDKKVMPFGAMYEYQPRNNDIRSKTGIVGIRLCKIKEYNIYNGKIYGPYQKEKYLAVWGPKGKQKVRAFSVKRYGKAMAFRLACQARKDGIKALRNYESLSAQSPAPTQC